MLLIPCCLGAQNLEGELKELQSELARLKDAQKEVEGKIEGVKLRGVSADLQAHGLPEVLPGEEVLHHSCLSLVYSEEHEQAKWVAHVIMPEIIEGRVSRTNDFRVDPLVKTGSTVEADYFLKTEQADGSFEYDGFGYDRGHLAPSADFRWSQAALSESYFYSNMSPQLPEFNRETWADLESDVRGYIFRNPTSKLYVVTGPILKENLPKVERSVNKVSIPEHFFKVVIDLEHKRGIGFVVPNKVEHSPVAEYAKTIDEVEQWTHIDFFAGLPEDVEAEIEAQKDLDLWLPDRPVGDVEPLYAPNLPKDHFNTTQAKIYQNGKKKVFICGTVVSGRYSRSGNILLNLDKKYPDQVFTVFIRKENILNFSFDPEKELTGQKICVHGLVEKVGDTPAMFVKHERDLFVMEKIGN